MEDGTEKVVFSGDTLFIGGIAKSALLTINRLKLMPRMRKILRGNTCGNAYSAEQDTSGSARRYESLCAPFSLTTISAETC